MNGGKDLIIVCVCVGRGGAKFQEGYLILYKITWHEIRWHDELMDLWSKLGASRPHLSRLPVPSIHTPCSYTFSQTVVSQATASCTHGGDALVGKKPVVHGESDHEGAGP